MSILKSIGIVAIVLGIITSCSSGNATSGVKLGSVNDCDLLIEGACNQLDGLVALSIKEDRIPRTLTPTGEMHWARESFDWTEGFFPGSMWLLYDYTKDPKWKDVAENLQDNIAEHRFIKYSHDLGFIFNCSFGRGYELTQNPQYKNYVVDAANSLIGRFSDDVGCIKSWDVDSGWQSKRGWQYPVIIDNMMNLEMLFKVAEYTGDKKYERIAITHANTTLKNHFRPDWSSYHVIDYDSINGNVRVKETAQGFAHESAWARGQAWGLYGYTVCYRYTQDKRYLNAAEQIASFIFNHENLPADKVPYWDYNAPKIPNEPRDVSAAAIVASALLELDEYSSNNYKATAIEIIENLSTDPYLADLNTNSNFLLKHSVGSIPHGSEIDVPLNYADYYYLEALLRLKEIRAQESK